MRFGDACSADPVSLAELRRNSAPRSPSQLWLQGFGNRFGPFPSALRDREKRMFGAARGCSTPPPSLGLSSRGATQSHGNAKLLGAGCAPSQTMGAAACLRRPAAMR
jgi:hypothetical protein